MEFWCNYWRDNVSIFRNRDGSSKNNIDASAGSTDGTGSVYVDLNVDGEEGKGTSGKHRSRNR